jgi:hypothetical protein
VVAAKGKTNAEILHAFPDLEVGDLHKALACAANPLSDRELPLRNGEIRNTDHQPLPNGRGSMAYGS